MLYTEEEAKDQEKISFCDFLKVFTCVLFQYLFWEKCAVFILYLVYNSLALLLICKFIIVYNNSE